MQEDKISIYAIFAGLIAFVLIQFNNDTMQKKGVLSLCAAAITLTMIWIIYDYVTVKRMKKLHKNYEKKNIHRDPVQMAAIEQAKDIENMREIDEIVSVINRLNGEPSVNYYDKTENGDIISKPMRIYDKETGQEVQTNDKPLYENYQDLAKLNYYNAEGLKCSYDTGLTTYKTSDLIGPTKADTFEEAYNLVGCNGDTRIANRMKFQGLKDKMAKDIRVRQDRRSAQKYFGDELNIEERRVWWENPDVYDSVM
jgi:hypothetical protein